MRSGHSVIGLDIGRHSIKAAWTEIRGGRPSVKRAESLRAPAGLSDRPAVIRAWIEKTGIAGSPCVIGLPGRDAMFQPFFVPTEDPRSLEQTASMEVVQYNEMASEAMIYGFAPFNLEPQEKRMLLAMVRPSVLDEIIGFAQALGVSIMDIIPTPVALFNAFESGGAKHGEPWLYLDVGHSGTGMAIGISGNLMFARSVEGGGRLFTDAAARAGGMSEAQAEDAKMRRGSLTQGNMAEMFAAPAKLWNSELETALSVFRSQFPRKWTALKRIVVAGGGSLLDGLCGYLTDRTGIETVSGLMPAGSAASRTGPEFAVAVGLAVTGLQAAPAPISVMPARMRDELTFRRQKPFWIGAGIAAALTLAVSLAGGYRGTKEDQARLGKIKEQLDRRSLLGAQIDAIKSSSDRIRRMSAPVKRLVEAGPVMRDLIALVSQSIADNDWITLICDADMYFSPGMRPSAQTSDKLGLRDRQRRERERGDKSGGKDLERVIIEGYTRSHDLLTVKKMIRDLNNAAFVASADLLSDDKVLDPEGNDPRSRWARRFVVDVQLAER